MHAQQAPDAAKVQYRVSRLNKQMSFIVLWLTVPKKRRRAGNAI